MSRHSEAFHVDRVLLVTDDPSLERIVTRGFVDAGLGIRAVQTAKQAVQLLSQDAFEFIVADEPLLGMSGRELLEQVTVRFPRVKRVLLVGTKVGLAAPADNPRDTDILNRRCNPNHLVGAVRRKMERRSGLLRPRRSHGPASRGRESLSP